MANVNKTLGNKLAAIAKKQAETAIAFKQNRMAEIKMNEDLNHGKSLPRLRGRFAVPLPTMAGFTDTLMSKIDEAPTITYSTDELAAKKKVKKANALKDKELKRRSLRWKAKDRATKHLAIFSGVGIAEFYAESDPRYRNYMHVIDHYDFFSEPMGGSYLENHSFCGRNNLFKTKYDLEQGAESGLYDKDKVQQLFNKSDQNDRKEYQDTYNNKMNRFALLGLDPQSHDYLGDEVFALTWQGLTYQGDRYLILYDYNTGIWVRCEKLEDVHESGLWPWTAWHTHPDEFVFWSKAPADDIRPVAVAIDIIFNQALDNRQKRNFGQRAYDPQVFPNPEDLEWRPDGLVKATPGVKQISQGIYEFQTPEVTGTIDMISFMDGFLAQKTGISGSAQGDSEEKAVGIFFGELQQVADRLGLYNKSYSDFHEEIGLRMLWGMKEHLVEEEAVRLIGPDGVEATELIGTEVDPEWDIDVSGGQAEFRANEVKKQKRKEILAEVVGNPDLVKRINPDWLVEQMLLTGEWDDNEIKAAMDLDGVLSNDLIAEAEMALEDLVGGGNPPINRQANVAFINYLIEYAIETKFSDDDEEDVKMVRKIEEYAQQHVEIAQRNAEKAARSIVRQQVMNGQRGPVKIDPRGVETPPAEGDAFAVADENPAGTPGGTQSQSQQISSDITP